MQDKAVFHIPSKQLKTHSSKWFS